jgi:hypothetical protein
MRQAFLMERRYAPYSKWFGTAFTRLVCAGRLGRDLDGVLAARTWPERDQRLNRAYQTVAALHNDLGISDPLPTDLADYYGRPFLVLHAGRFASEIQECIADERVRKLPEGVGGIDRFANAGDPLENTRWWRTLKAVYAPEA